MGRWAWLGAGLIWVGCAQDHVPAGVDGGTDAGLPPDAAAPRDAGPPDAGADAGECVPAPIIAPSLLPACDFCQGRCVSGAGIGEETRAQLRDCSESHECVPDEFLETGGNFTPESCRSVLALEGRCLSLCLESVAAMMDTFPQDLCPETHRCVPCYDPTDGTATGACAVGCDEGPVEPPFLLAPCCDGAGTCVPAAAVPEGAREHFEGCGAGDPAALCVPDVLIDDPGFVPPPCTTGAIRETWGEAYGPGGCLPACLAGLDPYRDSLEQNDCAAGSVCVPCTSPVDDTPTGACP